MKKRAGSLGLLLLPLSICAADAPRYTFSCDAPAGNFSDWTRTLSAKRIEIAGKMQVGDLYEHKKWRPVAYVSLLPDAQKGARFGFRISAEGFKAKTLTVDLFKVGGHQAMATVARSKSWIPFKLSMHPDGTIEGTFGEAKATVNAGAFEAKTLSLSCSSASFDFADLTVEEKD